MGSVEGKEIGSLGALVTSILVMATLLFASSSYSSVWHNDLEWGQFVMGLSGATAIVLLLSVMFSSLGNARLSKVTFVLGVLLLIVVVAMSVMEMMDRVTVSG